jgi:hypothetical protein
VDFVDKNDTARFGACQQSRKITRFVNHGARGGLDRNTHRFAEDKGQCGFAEAGRTGKQDVVERLAALPSGLDGKHQSVADFLLSDKVGKAGWAQSIVERSVALVKLF